MKLTGSHVQTFLKNPDPSIRAILVYGPDDGLVRERAVRLAATVVDDLSDPFRVVTLSGPDLARDPARLFDEACALSLTGGRRLVWIRDTQDAQTAAFKGFVENPVGDALVLVQSGNLGPRSSLRKLFEAAPKAAALPCYADEGRSLETVIREMFADAGVAADADVLAFLSDHLGADRALTRSEIDKLVTYAGAVKRITLDDAKDCVGDSARLGLDDLVNATAEGDAPRALRTLSRLLGEGTAGVAIVRAFLRHFLRLQLVCAHRAAGETMDKAMAVLKPPVFFSQNAVFRAQVNRWSVERLAQAQDLLLEAEGDLKTTGALETPIMERLVLRLTRGARGR